MPNPPVLVTIPISHFCEKARWALDRAGAPYVEEPHLPFFHVLATRRRSPSSSTPQLFTDGASFRSSTDVLKYAEEKGARLYPESPDDRAAVDRWIARLDTELGPHVRRYAYHSLLERPDLYLPLFAKGIPGHEAFALPRLHRHAAKLMRRAMRIDDEGARRSRAVIDRILADVDDALGPDGRFLVGNRFTAADLTLAALLCPLVQPPESLYASLANADFPPELVAHRDALRLTPSGRAVLRHYAEERRR